MSRVCKDEGMHTKHLVRRSAPLPPSLLVDKSKTLNQNLVTIKKEKMGVRGLYRWLVNRYPNTLCCVAEERSNFSTDTKTDLTTPNPNGVEFDNLYIDMNGVIHPCFHPEGLPAPKSYDDVLMSIFIYLDRVFYIVRPRKLLFLAVDGVAPRAKMKHQRVRRFRAAREAAGKSEGDKKLDSNAITPGTEFMDLLSRALTYYVSLKMENNRAWREIKVVLSDSTVVGEGEDKILTFIRSQRNLAGYDPNTRHCVHGLDADLIMLSLATHEIHISILREVEAYSWRLKMKTDGDRKPDYLTFMRYYIDRLQFEFFNIWVLREYLERELLPRLDGTDFERLIDDFVFFCIFVGNDYLPHLPSLDVTEGGIEVLMSVYQQEFPKMGHLTDSSKVNLKSMQHFLQALSSHENAMFSKRCQHPDKQRKRTGSQDATVNMHEKYTKPKYYTSNFDCELHDVDRIKRDAVLKYTQGVCWIMHSYYQRVCSWKWFYPYHYAPCASDFCDVDKLEINFTLGQPFKPLDQLLGVLPAASAQELPRSYRELMTEKSSPILDFYPEDMKVDLNGKKHAWQGVYKLPFIDESRLVSEIAKVEHTLTAKEKQRNMLGRDRLFVHKSHPMAKVIPDADPTQELKIQISPELSGGMNGYLCISEKLVCRNGQVPSPFADEKHLTNIWVKSFYYKRPSYAPHIPKLLCGVIMPPKILRSQDIPRPLVVWCARSIPSEKKVSEISEQQEVVEKVQGIMVEKDAEKLVDEAKKEKQEKSIDEKPKGEEVDLVRKKHKKRRGVEKKESHGEMEGDVRKTQVDDTMVEGGARKRKKQKKSKLLEDEKSDGEKSKKKKSSEIVDGEGEENHGESERKKQKSDGEKSEKKSSEIVDGEDEEHCGESERKRKKSDGEKSKKKKKKKNKSSEIVDGKTEEHHHHHELEAVESEDDKRKKQEKKSFEIVDEQQEGGESERKKQKTEEHHHEHKEEAGESEDKKTKKQESDVEKSVEIVVVRSVEEKGEEEGTTTRSKQVNDESETKQQGVEEEIDSNQ